MFQRLPVVRTSGAAMLNPNSATRAGMAGSSGARGDKRARIGIADADSVMTPPRPGEKLDADGCNQHHAEYEGLVLRIDSQQIERVRDDRQEQGSKHYSLGPACTSHERDASDHRSRDRFQRHRTSQ